MPDTAEHLTKARESAANQNACRLQPIFHKFCDDLAARFELDIGNPIRSNATEPTTREREAIELWRFAPETCISDDCR